MGLVYFFLVWHRGEYHFIIAETQEFIAPHFYNFMSNWEFWEDSLGSNFGGGRDYYLVTASYWLPILLSKFLQISIWKIYLVQTPLVPLLILIILYKITGLFYERSIDRILPVALMAFYNWRITHIGLGTYAFGDLDGYQGNDFFITILLGTYFFFKRAPVKTGLFLGISQLTHIGQTLTVGPFLIIMWPIIHKDKTLKPILILIGFFFIGGFIEWILLENAFPNAGPKINPELQWDALITNGHLNNPSLQPTRFILCSIMLSTLAILSYGISENSQQKQMILFGAGWLLTMFVGYHFALTFKVIPLIKINLLRFSNYFLFIIFLAIHIPKERNKRIIFVCFIMALFCYFINQPYQGTFPKINFLEVILFVITVIAGFSFLLFSCRLSQQTKEGSVKGLSYCLIIGLLLSVPLQTIMFWLNRESIEHAKRYEVVKFIRENIGEEHRFIFWGESPRGHAIAPMTNNSVMDVWVTWRNAYWGDKKRYDENKKKTLILIPDLYKNGGLAYSLAEKKKLVDAKLKNEPFLERYAKYYKKNFKIEFVLSGSRIKSVGETIFDNGTYKIMRL